MESRTMNTRDFIKMQSINFCYMSYMLQVSNSDSVEMETKYVKELFVDGDTISVLMQDGEVIYVIDLDPEVSTQAISEWIDKNPELHEKVLAAMNTNQ